LCDLRVGSAFGYAGQPLIIAVGDVILGDVVDGGRPDAVIAENVPQRLIEVLGGIRTPDIVR